MYRLNVSKRLCPAPLTRALTASNLFSYTSAATVSSRIVVNTNRQKWAAVSSGLSKQIHQSHARLFSQSTNSPSSNSTSSSSSTSVSSSSPSSPPSSAPEFVTDSASFIPESSYEADDQAAVRAFSRGVKISVIVLLTGVIVAATASSTLDTQRKDKLNEPRVFRDGSPLLFVERELNSGDVLFFSHGMDHRPLRSAIQFLQRLCGKSEWDHVGLIVVKNDFPYVLEMDLEGKIQFHSFESRVLHSHAASITVRRLACDISDEDKDRLEKWSDKLLAQQEKLKKQTENGVSTPADQTGAHPYNDVLSTPFINYLSSHHVASSLFTYDLLSDVCLAHFFPTSSSLQFSPVSQKRGTHRVELMGQFLSMWQFGKKNQDKLLRISLETKAAEASRKSQGDEDAKQGDSAHGYLKSGSKKARGAIQEAVMRLPSIYRSLGLDFAKRQDVMAKTKQMTHLTHSISPSSVLVAQGLQVLGVLPTRQDEITAYTPYLVETTDENTGNKVKTVPPIILHAAPPMLERTDLTPYIPSAMDYIPRHFFSEDAEAPVMNMKHLAEQAALKENPNQVYYPLPPECCLNQQFFIQGYGKSLEYKLDMYED